MYQVVVIPYPGRGHINSILNLCHLLSSRPNHTTIFTIVVTEEWLRLLNPNQTNNIKFVTIPNVIPSELNRGSDMISFLTAVKTKMEQPFEDMFDRISVDIPVKLIIADAMMMWPFDVGNRRNIFVVAYWPMSAAMFSVKHHVDLLESHHHLYLDVEESGHEQIDYIPGMTLLTIADIPQIFHRGIGDKLKNLVADPVEITKKAYCVLLSTIYELECKVIDALRARLHIPVYTSGPNIPYSQIKRNPSLHEPNYLSWLNSKPPRTVLYVSLGSYLSVSRGEMDEIGAGLIQSGVKFLLVANGETAKFKEMCGGNGMVVDWCDQLSVLLHSSIGGFLTHCGWNSVKESLFSGVPMVSFPLRFDQPLNSKVIVKDWKVGLKMRNEVGIFKRDKIAEFLRWFMDSKCMERIEIMERVKDLQKRCQESVDEGGSAIEDLDTFIGDVVMIQKK